MLAEPQPEVSPELIFFSDIYSSYEAVVSSLTSSDSYPPGSLGGKLVFAGDLLAGRNLLYASNIAGAASIAASSDASLQRQAIRAGVVDFIVTSLEEALRILKNEIRKKETVSVGVAVPEAQLVAEMLDRGVLPDLLPQIAAEDGPNFSGFLKHGALVVAVRSKQTSLEEIGSASWFVTWSVGSQSARWLPLLDRCASEQIVAQDTLRQRWIRLAPRYLGGQAKRVHGVAMREEEFARFRTAAFNLMDSSDAGTSEPVSLTVERSRLY